MSTFFRGAAMGTALFFVCVSANARDDEPSYGFFPGIRMGYGSGTYYGSLNTPSAGSGKSNHSELFEPHLDLIYIFADRVGLGGSVGYLWAGIKDPSDDKDDAFSLHGFSFTAQVMVNVLPRLFVTARGGIIKGSSEPVMDAPEDTTATRYGGGVTWAFYHFETGNAGVQLGFDHIASGTLHFFDQQVKFETTTLTLDLTFALR